MRRFFFGRITYGNPDKNSRNNLRGEAGGAGSKKT
jgi:hypothetical protein